jgi:hypothetical protein
MRPGPGDLILYSGRHPLHVRQYEITGCRWTQVALAVEMPGYGGPLVFESTMLSPCKDVIIGGVQRGVQIVRWCERVGTFDGRIALRKWSPPIDEVAIARLHAFVREVHGRPFDESPWTAVRALRRRNRPAANESFFCSQLVAEALQRMGLLARPPDAPSSNNYIPADFSTEYSDALLPLVGGHSLDFERLI